jgi:hypothetical protein
MVWFCLYFCVLLLSFWCLRMRSNQFRNNLIELPLTEPNQQIMAKPTPLQRHQLGQLQQYQPPQVVASGLIAQRNNRNNKEQKPKSRRFRVDLHTGVGVKLHGSASAWNCLVRLFEDIEPIFHSVDEVDRRRLRLVRLEPVGSLALPLAHILDVSMAKVAAKVALDANDYPLLYQVPAGAQILLHVSKAGNASQRETKWEVRIEIEDPEHPPDAEQDLALDSYSMSGIVLDETAKREVLLRPKILTRDRGTPEVGDTCKEKTIAFLWFMLRLLTYQQYKSTFIWIILGIGATIGGMVWAERDGTIECEEDNRAMYLLLGSCCLITAITGVWLLEALRVAGVVRRGLLSKELHVMLNLGLWDEDALIDVTIIRPDGGGAASSSESETDAETDSDESDSNGIVLNDEKHADYYYAAPAAAAAAAAAAGSTQSIKTRTESSNKKKNKKKSKKKSKSKNKSNKKSKKSKKKKKTME